MKFLVRNIDIVIANIEKAGAPIITTSGVPVSVKWPDGPRQGDRLP
jgi:hypothetical protein